MISAIKTALRDARHVLQRQIGPSLGPEQLEGWCELAEAVEYHQLSRAGVETCNLHSNQVEELGGDFRHAFLVVGDRSQSHLLDPTFSQFLARPPGQHLQQSEEGKALLARLLEDGHAPWSRQTASVYAQALGMPANTYDLALSSQRPMNYQPLLFESLLT